MALHPMGFFICNSLMVALGVFRTDSPHGMYTYDMNGNVGVFLIYMFFAISFPLLIIWGFRKIKTLIICQK